MNGSIRQRSAGSWELRAYVGVDPATGRRLDRSITVRGNRSDAERELAEMVARIRCVRAVGSRSTTSELFEAWFATAVDGWSPSTVRQNRGARPRADKDETPTRNRSRRTILPTARQPGGSCEQFVARGVHLQRRRRRDSVKAEPGDEILPPASPGRRVGAVPTSRPPPFHGHRDAQRRRTSRGRFAPARPQARLNNLRQVCPRSARARRAGIGDSLARHEHGLRGPQLKRAHSCASLAHGATPPIDVGTRGKVQQLVYYSKS